jgi:hypothetical protein
MRTSEGHRALQRASTIIRIVADTGGGKGIFRDPKATGERGGE